MVLLTKNSAIQCLNLSGNDIGNDGMRIITDVMICNNTLIMLSAEGCGISVEGSNRWLVLHTYMHNII